MNLQRISIIKQKYLFDIFASFLVKGKWTFNIQNVKIWWLLFFKCSYK